MSAVLLKFIKEFYRRMQKDSPYKTLTTLMQICNKNVPDLLRECINFVRTSHDLVTILQQIRTTIQSHLFERCDFVAR